MISTFDNELVRGKSIDRFVPTGLYSCSSLRHRYLARLEGCFRFYKDYTSRIGELARILLMKNVLGLPSGAKIGLF